MARWDPGTEQRLSRAALDLFAERGYENVTVTDIAERAGITRRTYFRYFPDKREVLFAGSQRLPGEVGERVRAADQRTTPLAATLQAMAEAGAWFEEHAAGHAAQRLRVIKASPELEERERSKLAALTTAVEQALEGRGCSPALARATAGLGTFAFAAAFEDWVRTGEPFADCLEAATSALREAVRG